MAALFFSLSGLAQAQQPIAVPLVTVPSQPPPVVTAPAPPVVQRTPPTTSCDAGGCWDASGARLNRAGPNLSGPRGLCTVQGAAVNCP